MKVGCFLFLPTFIYLSTKDFALLIGKPKNDKKALVEKTD